MLPASSVVTYRSRRSKVLHLASGCRHLTNAHFVVRERKVGNLWPGFVCETCRAAATCPTCDCIWPYCACDGDKD